tara:strand:+ start:971 stop:1666 length:696 start_codon:yes stop_codon:yes gene_type:complete
MREIIIDTETTGLEIKEGHRIIEIAAIELNNLILTGKSFHSYINPERKIEEGAYKIHGISNDFLSDKPKFTEIADKFLDFIQDSILVIHNAKFDISFINYELGLCNKLKIINNEIKDTLEIAKTQNPGAHASLDALCKRFNINIEHREKHGALKDVFLLAEVYIELQGGKQQDLNIFTSDEKSHNHNINTEKNNTTKLKVRNFPVNQNELENHNKFIKKIENSVWGKYLKT